MRRGSISVWVTAAWLLTGCGGDGNTPSGEQGGSGGTAASAGSAGSETTGTTGGSTRGGAPPAASGSNPGGAMTGGSTSGGASSSGAGGTMLGTGGMGGSGGVPALGALEPTVKAFCAAARSCCEQQQVPATLDDCESQFAMKNETAASLASGAVTLNADALARCLAAYEKASTSCEMNSVLSACQGVVVGTRAENESCRQGSECARDPGPNTCLITTPNGTVGVCKKIVHAQSGMPCDITCRKGEDCTFTTYAGPEGATLAICFEEEGLYCDYSGDSRQCKPLLALGSPCDADDPCGSLAYCDTTCKKRATEGESCTRCLSSLTCVDNQCVSPGFASLNTCEGRSLGPY